MAVTCSNSACTNHTIFKETLQFEDYLINLDFKYMKDLCKFILNSRNASTLKQISNCIGLIFSKFVYMDNIDRDVILLRENVEVVAQ